MASLETCVDIRSQLVSDTFNAIMEKSQPFISQTHLLSFLQDFEIVSRYLEIRVRRYKYSRLTARQGMQAEITAFTRSTDDIANFEESRQALGHSGRARATSLLLEGRVTFAV